MKEIAVVRERKVGWIEDEKKIVNCYQIVKKKEELAKKNNKKIINKNKKVQK